MDLLHTFLAVLQDLPTYINAWSAQMGVWIYLVLFLIIFAETGLIVTPFLPGDSLLFALGALAAVENATLNIWILAVVMIVAAVLGDAVNYSVGRYLAPLIFRNPSSKLFNPQHLARTQAFYDRHGGKTIILARFLPIIRTYAPFVAGMARMTYPRFATYNVAGGVVWILGFLLAGYYFGNIPSVKTNFHIVIIAIIVISALPALLEVIRVRRQGAL